MTKPIRMLGLLVALWLPLSAHAADWEETVQLEHDLEDALRDAVAERSQWSPDQIAISGLSVPAGLDASAGFVRVELPENARLNGHLPFQVVAANETGLLRQWGSARVEVMVDVIVAARTIGRHETLTDADLGHARLPLSRVHGGVLDMDHAIGLRATRRIAQGSPVTSALVEAPPVVHRGDQVTLVARRPGLLVSTLAEAREDGAQDGVIDVVNLSSRRTVQGRVVDASTVEVPF